jgi:pimeloyl-ACP methyl ester carboxylesterase
VTEITAHHGLFRDTRLHVDDTGGSGRPVVLIHGWPLSGEAWSAQVPALEQAGYRVVTYDRRGFGRSDKPKHGYTYDSLTEDLHTLLDALDLEEVTLVGFSMGGGEVARYFSLYGSERLHSVVFASAVPAADRRQPRGAIDEERSSEDDCISYEEPECLLRGLHHRVLLSRRRIESDRQPTSNRIVSLSSGRQDGGVGVHGGVRGLPTFVMTSPRST